MAAFHADVAYRPHHLGHTDVGTKVADAVARAYATVQTWRMRASARRELGKLSNHLLADIGMSRADVTKPFWQA